VVLTGIAVVNGRVRMAGVGRAHPSWLEGGGVRPEQTRQPNERDSHGVVPFQDLLSSGSLAGSRVGASILLAPNIPHPFPYIQGFFYLD
jgi:hypothetical protein